jgi:hypothetical protein
MAGSFLLQEGPVPESTKEGRISFEKRQISRDFRRHPLMRELAYGIAHPSNFYACAKPPRLVS